MKNIEIFNAVVTEDVLKILDAESEKYKGLYCDLSNKEERKFVKDKAQEINNLLKKLDRSRIDIAKEYKYKVEIEASQIRERLENANRPFTALIDEWTAQRKAILDTKKAEEDAKQSAIQFQIDFDDALTMNKLFDFERKERLAREAEELEKIKLQAVEDAMLQLELEAQKKIDDEEERKITAQKDREKAATELKRKNIAHQIKVNNDALESMIDHGIDHGTAKTIIKLIAKGKIINVSINY